MPKASRTKQEIELIRDMILDTALQLIIDGGFSSLSMRRIASRLGITATTIYNYVSCKDEMNLLIRMRGFGMLYDKLERGYESGRTHEGRLGAMIRGYAEFGVSFPAYYDIMFNMATPKYRDYVGTEMEPAALREKEIALRCFDIFTRLLREYVEDYRLDVDEGFINGHILALWSDLHGIISLFNSRVLLEVNEEGQTIIDRRVNDIIAAALPLNGSPRGMTDKKKRKR